MYILSLEGENQMRKTVIVNLYGAPGAGKSTGSAYIFGQLKMNNISVELVREFVEDKIYEKSEGVFNDQVYILGKQHFRQTNVKGNVDVIITDCPLIVQAYYTDKYFKMTILKDVDVIVTDAPLILLSYYSKKNGFPYTSELEQLILSILPLVDNVNYFINRCVPYDTRGRFQTEEEADIIADEMKSYLNNLNIKYKELDGVKESYDLIVNEILEKLKEK